MLHGHGIVTGFKSGNGVIASAVGARQVPCVAVNIGHGDLRIGKHGAGRIKDNTSDGAGSDLRKRAFNTQRGHHKAEDEKGKNSLYEEAVNFRHS